jgi:hypothetical protein
VVFAYREMLAGAFGRRRHGARPTDKDAVVIYENIFCRTR